MSSRAHDPSDPVLPRDAGQPERRRTLLQDGTVLRGDFSSDGIVELGGTPMGGTPAEFGAILTEASDKWAKVIKAAGIKAE